MTARRTPRDSSPTAPVPDHAAEAAETGGGAARPVKRSFTIAGHRTSISLEAAFWDAFRAIAAAEQRSLAGLLTEIDSNRGDAGLSSAVRVFVLDRFRRTAASPLEDGTTPIDRDSA